MLLTLLLNVIELSKIKGFSDKLCFGIKNKVSGNIQHFWAIRRYKMKSLIVLVGLIACEFF